MLLKTQMNTNIQLVMNSFGTLFHDKIFSLTVNKIPDISLPCFKFPDISGFCRQSGHPVKLPCPTQGAAGPWLIQCHTPIAFSNLTLLVGQQSGHLTSKNLAEATMWELDSVTRIKVRTILNKICSNNDGDCDGASSSS